MTSHILEGKWTQLRGKAQARWGRLTNDDWHQIEGQRAKLEGKLQERYGYTRNEASSQVDSFLRDAGEQIGDAQTRLEEKMRDTEQQIRDRVDDARHRMQERADYYDTRLREAKPADLVQTVKRNPVPFVVAFIVIAVLIGFWVKSMNSSRPLR